MRSHLLRGAHGLLGFMRVASGLLLVASVAINFVNIIGRYFFSVSLQWAEEMMLFLMVGCVFLGIGLVGWSGRHIRMDVIISLLPPRPRKAMEVFADLVVIVTSFALAIFAWPVIHMLAAFDQRSEAANIPLVIPQAMVPIGLAVMALLVALRLLFHGDRRAGEPDRRSEL
jgi:TRAP-type C4-dicarboxylate transport system permease small subunit